jgi:hypothetical protein
MQAYLVGAAAAAMMLSASAQAAPNAPRGARSVQLISMSPPRKEDRAIVSEPGVERMDGATPREQREAAFRVHDLSRRWVEFRMASSFAQSAMGSVPSDEDDPYARAGGAQPTNMPVADYLQSASSIPVPLWMRGRSLVASASSRYVPGCAALAYRPSGFLRSDAEIRRASYYDLMSNIACEHGIPVGLFDAMIIRESRYRPDASSPKSAFGLTQLMPGTAIALGVNRYNVAENLRGGAKYLRQQLDRFGQYHLALAAYNAGPGRVRNGLVPQIAETQAYVENVLSNWSRLSGSYRQAAIVSGHPTARASIPLGRSISISTF